MTEELQETNKPTKYFLIIGAVVFIGVLAFILFGIKGKPPEEEKTVEYNYFTFEQIGGLWQTNIALGDKTYEAVFRFNPTQVEDVYIAGNLTTFNQQPIYITFDPDSDREQFKYLALASTELSLHLIRALNKTLEAACTKNETDACIDRPIVTCEDKDKSVIYLVSKPPTQITLQGNCVILNGIGMDLLKSVDRLLFQWYKIKR